MITNLEIKNFKSIRELNFDCKRINIFIGEPNAGKSNILEALNLLSFLKFGQIEDFIRIDSMNNLFRDENLDEDISIRADAAILEIASKDDLFYGRCFNKEPDEKEFFKFVFDYKMRGSRNLNFEPFPIRPYKFFTKKDFYQKESDFLLPPYGDNLMSVLRSHKRIKNAITYLFDPFGLRLVFRLQENKMEIMKQQESDIVSFPYWLLSDTLQRIIFYTAAIDSNDGSILIFEEPESHSFPYYTKFLGEKIAFDEKNQYFIATHNPYLLLAILEKAKKNSVNVFIVYFKNYETKIKCLSDEQISELINYDPFFNLEAFIEGNTC